MKNVTVYLCMFVGFIDMSHVAGDDTYNSRTADFCVVTNSYLVLDTHGQFLYELTWPSTDFDWGMFFLSLVYSANRKLRLVENFVKFLIGDSSHVVYRCVQLVEKFIPCVSWCVHLGLCEWTLADLCKDLNCLVDYCSGIKVSYFLFFMFSPSQCHLI